MTAWKKGAILVILVLVLISSGCAELSSSQTTPTTTTPAPVVTTTPIPVVTTSPPPTEPPMVKIVNAKLELGSLVLSLEANQTVEDVRIDAIDEYGQVLCTRYKDLVEGVTELELKDCEIRRKITISVSPPDGVMRTKDFQFELPSVRIKDARFERGDIIITVDADEATDNVRVDIVDESDQILCTKYKDLVKGVTEVELTECEIRERITVFVSPPKAEMITTDFTLTLPEIRIKDARSELGKIIVTLDANMDISDARIHVFGSSGEVLCSRREDLAKGLGELELKRCQIQEEITVSVSPPIGKTTTRDFTLELPLLELKEGFKYVYATTQCPDCSKRDSSIYVTKETSRYWEGITGIKIDGSKKAYLMRWMIDKDNLDISMTRPLTEDALLGDVDYIDDVKQMGNIGDAGASMLPLWMVIIKEMFDLDMDELITTHTTTAVVDRQSVTFNTSDPARYGNYLAYTLDIVVYQDDNLKETGEFVISVAKPYLMMETDMGEDSQTSFRRVEQKEFSLDDYAGYSIEEWTPPPPPPDEPKPGKTPGVDEDDNPIKGT